MPANVSSDQLSFVNPSKYFMQVAQTTLKIQAMPSTPHAILIISIQKIKNAPARVF
jgi:P pilus assembly chaperone PapD